MADRPTSIVAAMFLGCVGAFAALAQPIVVEVLVSRMGLERSAAAAVVAFEALGTALGPVLAMFWKERVSWRTAAIAALAVVVIGNGLSILPMDTRLLTILRFTVGLLGEGTAFALGVAILGASAQKDRNFAFMIAAQVTLGVVLFLTLPMPRDAGVGGVWLPLGAFALVALLTTRCIPQRPAGVQPYRAAAGGKAGSALPALGALVAMVIWCAGLGAVWAFVKLLGVELTCPGCAAAEKAAAAVAVGRALAVTMTLGIAGALTAAALADRLGRILPVTLALLLQLAMVQMLRGEMSWLQFVATVGTFQFFWNMTGPYIMGTIALSDSTGKVSLLIPTGQTAGFFLGPMIVGWFLSEGSFTAVNAVSGACILLALVLFFLVASRVKKPAPITSART